MVKIIRCYWIFMFSGYIIISFLTVRYLMILAGMSNTIHFSFSGLHLSAIGLYRCVQYKCLLIIAYTLYKIGELKK